MSKWLVGSSIISTFKGWRSNLAKAKRLRSPPDRTFTYLSAASPLNKKEPNISRTLDLLVSFAASIIVSKTVLLPSKYSAWFWAKYPICTLWPNLTSPLASKSPTIILASVDFPCPFCPTKAILLPRSTIRSMCCNTFKSPYSLEIWVASTTTFPGVVETGNFSVMTLLSSSSTSIRSILSSFLISDCAMVALEALARNFSMSFSVCSICFCWFFWEANCNVFCSSLRTKYLV